MFLFLLFYFFMFNFYFCYFYFFLCFIYIVFIIFLFIAVLFYYIFFLHILILKCWILCFFIVFSVSFFFIIFLGGFCGKSFNIYSCIKSQLLGWSPKKKGAEKKKCMEGIPLWLGIGEPSPHPGPGLMDRRFPDTPRGRVAWPAAHFRGKRLFGAGGS